MDIARIELRHLRYFLAVADQRSFSRAAERLGMAQPPLSQQIAKLEVMVGEKLLERRPQVRLTAAGRALAESARKLLSQLERDLNETRRVGFGEAGTLTIGFPASALVTTFPDVVRRFREKYPELDLRLQEISSAEQVAALKEGAIDVGLVRGEVRDPALRCERFLEEPFVAVLPGSHKLASRKSVRLEELAGDDFILFPSTVAPALHDEVRTLFDEAGVQPVTVLEAQEWLTIIGLVETGIGITIAPASFRRLKWGEVHYASLTGTVARTSISACVARERTSPAAANFLAEMAD